MGVRVGRPMRTLVLLTFIIQSCTIIICPCGASDASTLLNFKASLRDASALQNWDLNTRPCTNDDQTNWVGVHCRNGHVTGLNLGNLGLKGMVDMNSLVALAHLRSLSFVSNTLSGPWPIDIRNLSQLRSLYLSDNHFWGEIPDDAFTDMFYLRKVLLTNNDFRGKIPSSLAALPRLADLRIDGNKFGGSVPDFNQSYLRRVNVSNNILDGEIPTNLKEMDPSNFAGNKNLCGPPLGQCNISAPSLAPEAPSPTPPPLIIVKTKPSPLPKVAIGIIVSGTLLSIIAVVLMLYTFRKRRQSQTPRSSTSKDLKKTSLDHNTNDSINQKEHRLVPEQVTYKTSMTSTTHHVVQQRKSNSTTSNIGEQGKVSFVRDDREIFDLNDLLRASAEILGSGTFGSSYKASILSDPVVVKRYKQMNNVGREEFHETMIRLGTLTHPNLLPLLAYYYRKEEKLLISDFVDNGSLASHLHGKQQQRLDWSTRLKIIKGIGRGLSYLYSTLPDIVVPHGHLKSSNVLLDESFDPLLTDYGLQPVINLDHAQHLMMAYKSPEYARHGRITKKTDVWSFGILILEILTGKFPENYLTQRYNSKADLASWVNELIKEKRTGEVFDVEMTGVRNNKGQLLRFLKIGLSCCEEDVERRLDLNELIAKIEELDEGDMSDGEQTTHSPHLASLQRSTSNDNPFASGEALR